MGSNTFLMAMDIYRAKGGKLTCSPNQSCEGETPDVVILKDFDGHLVAEVQLKDAVVKYSVEDLVEDSFDDKLSRPDSSLSKSGLFCYAVGFFTLVGGLSFAFLSFAFSDAYKGLRPLGLGIAGSSAPIFALGSVAHNVKWMAKATEKRD